MSERDPNTDNVHFMDEYPDISKKLWLRRLNAQRHLGVISIAGDPADVIEFPNPEPPDEPA